MTLPNGEHAIVDIRKLLDYCLNSEHPRGRNKARVFASIGIREADAEDLRTAILAAAVGTGAQRGVANVYGQRYIIDFEMPAPGKNRENPKRVDCADRGRLAATGQVVMYYE